jgi:hypothetical protein
MRVGFVVVTAALVLVGTSAASWSAASSGSGNAKAGALVGNKPSLSKSGVIVISVVVSWTATAGATGYVITRTGGVGSLGGTCTGTLTTTTCTDSPLVTLQTYTYSVTPRAGNWTGTAGPSTSIST